MTFGAVKKTAGVEYHAWSPDNPEIAVEIRPGTNGQTHRKLVMQRDQWGFHVAFDPEGQSGDRYQFVLPGGQRVPDPASRGQAECVHTFSVVTEAGAYRWKDADWQRPPFRDLVIYELHIGTFTPEGTFRAAIERLPHLRDLHVNAIELMPIGDFPGRWNWGYDGVLIYAPSRAYGSPDDLRAFIDAAHEHGIAVILDVVYNHFGPDGNYLGALSKAFFTEKHHTPWGAAFNFDGEHCEPVREFFVHNPVYWMEEFHIDGFRLDATHEITDDSPRHLLAEITAAIHARGGYAIAEDARNEAQMIADESDGGYGFDAVWADDFHHVLRVGQTKVREGYFEDFEGTLDELIETLQHGWLYRGRHSRVLKKDRGSECRHLPSSKFLFCLSNHDQTGNRAFGERLHQVVSPEAYRALSMLLCLSPYTPMLFMGQEWGASSPFLFFCDHNDQLGPLITEGRRREFSGFSGFKDHDALERIPDPQDEESFLRSKLKWEEPERPGHAELLALYSECLRMRAETAAFRPASRNSWQVARLNCGVGAIRYRASDEEYLLVFDLTGGQRGDLARDPLTNLPSGESWRHLFSSNEARFGGNGLPCFDAGDQSFAFAASGALLLKARA